MRHNLTGQVWTFVSAISNNNFFIVEDRGRVASNNKYEYSYLLYCIGDGKKIEYLLGEPIQEHGNWRRVA